jgi:hypothetical protein
MNETRPDRLYELLPAIYRMRDAEQGYPLQALLAAIDEQVSVLDEDIRQLYENWFIETCQDWVVPYIGALIGYQPVHEAGEPGDVTTERGLARNKILIPRRDVADTIHNRRRKGALALLEELAADVTGWQTRAVEFFRLLAWMQNINHLHLERARTVDLRNGDALDLLGRPFDNMARTLDARRINSALTRGRYNIPSVGLFVWRLKTYSVTDTQAYCLEENGPHCYTFSALGNDAPLYVKAERETEPTHIAEELNLPVPIRRRALEEDLRRAREEPGYTSRYYGADKSFAIWARDWPDESADHLVPPRAILVADLSDWQYRPAPNYIAVDPVLGRIAFPPSQLPRRDPERDVRRLRGVRVTYHYGFSADIGGGEYNRALQQPAGAELIRVRDVTELNSALARWRSDTDPFKEQPPHAVIEIVKSGVFVLPFDITLKANHTLQLRAANRTRPVIRLLDYQADFPDSLHVTMGPGSRLTLDGLLITGRPVHIRADREMRAQTEPQPTTADKQTSISGGDAPQNPETPQDSVCFTEVVIRHCTLVPGWGLDNNCDPKRPNEPSLELYNVRARVQIEHSILGSIQVNESQVTADPIPIQITDSILDATSDDREALGAPARRPAHAVLDIRRSTVFGIVEVHSIELAENSIFTGCLEVARRQLGCMRFCYVPPGCRTPRRYRCQPDLVEKPILELFAGDNISEEEKNQRIQMERLRVRPQFNSVRYGKPAYCQLAETCAIEIKRGADDESEMGVFHDLFNPQRDANLRARLNEYTPAGTDAGIIYAS